MVNITFFFWFINFWSNGIFKQMKIQFLKYVNSQNRIVDDFLSLNHTYLIFVAENGLTKVLGNDGTLFISLYNKRFE